MTTSADEERKLRKALAGSDTNMTLHSRAAADIALENQGGRFAEGASVSGGKPAVVYPRMPEGNPWSGEISDGVEPALGWSVEAQEPVGEVFEVEASLAAAAPAVPSASVRAAAPPSGFMSPREGGASPSPNVIAGSPSSDGVGGVAGRDEGPLFPTLAQRAASTFIRGRKL
jgi:hypothetical protein